MKTLTSAKLRKLKFKMTLHIGAPMSRRFERNEDFGLTLLTMTDMGREANYKIVGREIQADILPGKGEWNSCNLLAADRKQEITRFVRIYNKAARRKAA